MSKFWWMSFAFTIKGKCGYFNGYFETQEGDFVDTTFLQKMMCDDLKWDACSILFMREVSREAFEKAEARCITWLEISTKLKEQEQ